MKIGIDIRNIGKKRTGDEVVFFNLVKSLALIDVANEYKLFTDIAEEDKQKDIKNSLGISDKSNFEIISIPTNRFKWNFWSLGEYLRRNPVDAYLTQYITPWFVPKKVKILTIIHDISFNFYPQFIKKTDLLFLKTLLSHSLRRADGIIGVSKFTHDEIIRFYDIAPEKTFWIHNAVSDDFLAQNASLEKISAVREKYNLSEKYILYLGTLQPRKNLPNLIEAFALLKLAHPEIRLVLAGGKSHNYDKRIDNFVKNNHLDQDVLFPGFIDEQDKAAVMAGSLVFCFPSLYEGFGIPILEAMSLGVPVAISKIPAHEEIASGAASFFDPENPGDIYAKLLELANNPVLQQSLSFRGKEQVKKFSWQKSAEKLLEIFESMG
jgi:glycosyltransferase involved in cell wall biosynthesis